MRNTLFLVFALSIFASCSGCKDNTKVPGVDYNITFKATYNGAQLEKNKDYFFGTFPVLFVRYRLYLSDITLVKTDGSEVRLSEIEYLDFTPDSGASDLSVTPNITFSNVPEGTYDAIRLGFGVKSSLNAKQPSYFPTGHPLNVETDYWAGWKSYIFSVLDGKADPDGDGIKNLPLAYHCGSDAVFKTFTFNHSINVVKGGTGLGVEFDVHKLLTNDDGTLYDIVANPATSNSASDVTVGNALMEHYDTATKITD